MTRSLLFLLTPVLAVGVGWLLAPDHSGAAPSSLDSRHEINLRKSSLQLSSRGAVESAQTGLGRYRFLENGQRVYAGPRDISLLEKVTRNLPSDFAAFSEMMSQLSQMSDADLADAWADLSRQAPRHGEASSLLVAYVLTRLQAAGQEVFVPPSWADYGSGLTPAIEADAVRRDPERFLAILESGDPLSPMQRETLLLRLVQDNPSEATRLWLEHSNPQQLRMESQALAGLMSDPKAREQLLSGLEVKVADPVKRKDILAGLLREWAFIDREKLESFALGLKDPALEEIATVSLLRAYSEFEVEKGLSYASKLQGPMRDFAIGKSISTLSSDDLERAKEVAHSMDNPADRLVAIRSLSYEMASQNYPEYQEWRDQLPAHEKEAAIQESFTLYAAQETNEAVDWLNEQPEGLNKEVMKTKLMQVYVTDHPESVLGLLASFDNPYAKRNAAAIALQNSDPSDIPAIRTILGVANERESGVNLALQPGTTAAPLPPSREVPHNCASCGQH